ncbi:amidohydrolase [Pseudomonas sp. GD03860]|uniref:amidohydrolase family protein n=1 Tax=Pseudomonas TaxID=286 RepID=UPI0023642ABA|nr:MULTISPECIES: amidohydrolase family protein [Pseudomonas]MDD2058412.1 amidohydrolase [Pseudomonas putida]MDH0640224.1 amidohydrolase [Pseudomonas sp. GD03860]
MSGHFIFSADSHVLEPHDLFVQGLPPSLRRHAIRAEKQGDTLVTRTDEQVIFKMRLNVADIGGSKRVGLHNLDGRLEDMEKDGVDAEICFPSLGLWTYALEDIEAELATCQLYNDWNNQFFQGHLDRFVRCAILPVRDLANAIAELKRIAAKGITAAMLPSVTSRGIPRYNDPAWDPVFRTAGELGVVLVMHTGTGLETVIHERGPGAAVVNYTRQMSDGIEAVTYLVAGGVLDRNPKTQIAVIECGASWLGALAERMDEVFFAHAAFVQPKLSTKPSDIIRRQVKASFQHDRACIAARAVTGTGALMWASDYPHAEGTFPNSRKIIASLFEGIDISEQEKADILGGNAARLFRLARPEFL